MRGENLSGLLQYSPVSYPDFVALHDRNRSFSGLVAEPSQLGRSDEGMPFVFNKDIPKVSTTF
jgi:hypothetical protein